MAETPPPLVTALVPTYKGAGFITRSLDALAAQTWPNLEILIGDDHSPDNTLEVVRGWAEGRENVRIVERETNLGWLGNSNDLMARARGAYMFFAFHDDVVLPSYVEKLVTALEADPDAVLAFSDMTVVQTDGTEEHEVFTDLDGKTRLAERGMIMLRRTPGWWVPNRGVFRSAAFGRIGGIRPNDQGEYSADWTWLLHMSFLGSFIRIPETLCVKYYKAGSVSKAWPHNFAQRAALRRAGLAELGHAELPVWLSLKFKAYMRYRLFRDRLKALRTGTDIDTPRSVS